jgi:hypothetical protein
MLLPSLLVPKTKNPFKEEEKKKLIESEESPWFSKYWIFNKNLLDGILGHWIGILATRPLNQLSETKLYLHIPAGKSNTAQFSSFGIYPHTRNCPMKSWVIFLIPRFFSEIVLSNGTFHKEKSRIITI